MKVVLLLVALLCAGAAVAQFDAATIDSLKPLTLTAIAAPVPARQDGKSDLQSTVDADFVLGCDRKRHKIATLAVGNDPNVCEAANSGTHYEIQLVNSAVAAANPADAPANVATDLIGELRDHLDQAVPITEIGAAGATLNQGTCPVGQNCQFQVATGATGTVFYNCRVFPDNSTQAALWSVVIFQAAGANPVNLYTLRFTQFIERVQLVPATTDGFPLATLDTTTLENPPPAFAATVPGPRNWRHFFHQVKNSVATRHVQSNLRVYVTNFRDATAPNPVVVGGDVDLCTSVSNIVSHDAAIANGNNVASNARCPHVCSSANIAALTTQVTVLTPSCTVLDRVWIGVRWTGNARFNVTVDWSNLAPVVPQSSSVFTWDGSLQAISDGAGCDVSQSQYGCEDYYESSILSSKQTVASFNGILGPFFVAEVFGMNDGDLYVQVVDATVGPGIRGPRTACPALSNVVLATSQQCGGVTGVPAAAAPATGANAVFAAGAQGQAAAPIRETNCFITIPPCRWNRVVRTCTSTQQARSLYDNVWATTVVGGSYRDVAAVPRDNFIDYGINLEIVSMPETTIDFKGTTPPGPQYGEIREAHYHHYKVDFSSTGAALFDDSHFEVEFYTNHQENDATLFWNWDAHAGLAADCYNYMGACSTFGKSAAVTGANSRQWAAGTDTNFCRFLFIRCFRPQTAAGNDRRYAAVGGAVGIADGNFGKFSGVTAGETVTNDLLKVAELANTVYYFSVYGIIDGDNDNDNYQMPVRYTFMAMLSRALTLTIGKTIKQHVWYLDYSRQYCIPVPTDTSVARLRFRIADTANGPDNANGLRGYIQCGRNAGGCPCWDNFATETTRLNDGDGAGNDDDDRVMDLSIPACRCQQSKVCASVEGVGRDAEHRDLRPYGFTITAFYDRISDLSTTSTTLSIVQSVAVSEKETMVTGLIRRRLTAGQCCDNYAFFQFDFKGVTLKDTHALVTNAAFVPAQADIGGVADEHAQADTFINLFVGTGGLVGNAAAAAGFFCNNVFSTVKTCTASANNQLPPFNNAAPVAVRDELTVGDFSCCTVVFEPCHKVNPLANQCCTNTRLPFQPPTLNRAFDRTQTYFASIQAVDPNAANPLPTFTTQYTLTVQLVDQAASLNTLTLGTSLKATARESSYRHYQVASGLSGAGSSRTDLKRMLVEFYTNRDQIGQLWYFVNQGVQAGLPVDCYGSLHQTLGLCQICTTGRGPTANGGTATNGPNAQDLAINPTPGSEYCRYEFRPCELNGGTYFISVYLPGEQNRVDDFNLPLAPIWTAHTYYDNKFEFTMKVSVVDPVELVTNNQFPVSGHVYSQFNQAGTNFHGTSTTNYYVATVPSPFPTGVAGYELLIEVETVRAGNVFVTIDQSTRQSACSCRQSGRLVTQRAALVLGANDDLNYRRHPCHVAPGAKYYVTVDGISNNAADLMATSYTIHATLRNITNDAITFAPVAALAAPTVDPAVVLPIFGRWESLNIKDPAVGGPATTLGMATDKFQVGPTPSPKGPFPLQRFQYRSFSFTSAEVAGRSAAVYVRQGNVAAPNALQNLDIWLNIDQPGGPASANDDDGAAANDIQVGPLPPANVASCAPIHTCLNTNANTDATECRMTLLPCQFIGGKTYYVTIGGDKVAAGSSVINLHLGARLIDDELVNTPTTANVLPAAPVAVLTTTATNPLKIVAAPNAPVTAQNIDALYNRARYFKTASLGLLAGESLIFGLTGAPTVTVRYGGEIGTWNHAGAALANNIACPLTCTGAGTCTVYACEAVPAAVWYIQGDSYSVTQVSITLVASPPGTLTASNTGLSSGTSDTQTIVGPASNNGWNWHQITSTFTAGNEYETNLDATTATGFFCVPGADGSLCTGKPVALPGLQAHAANNFPQDVGLTATGVAVTGQVAAAKPTCGAVPVAPAAFDQKCCLTLPGTAGQFFAAVAGQNAVPVAPANYKLLWQYRSVGRTGAAGAAQTLGSDAVALVAGTTAAVPAATEVVWTKVSVAADANLWVHFLPTTVKAGTGKVYLQRGARAGAAGAAAACPAAGAYPATTDVLASCHTNIEVVCAGQAQGADCFRFFSACGCFGTTSTDYYFGISFTAGGQQTYTFNTATSTVSRSTLNSASAVTVGTSTNPPTAMALDFTATAVSPYNHFVVTFGLNEKNFGANYIPRQEELEVARAAPAAFGRRTTQHVEIQLRDLQINGAAAGWADANAPQVNYLLVQPNAPTLSAAGSTNANAGCGNGANIDAALCDAGLFTNAAGATVPGLLTGGTLGDGNAKVSATGGLRECHMKLDTVFTRCGLQLAISTRRSVAAPKATPATTSSTFSIVVEVFSGLPGIHKVALTANAAPAPTKSFVTADFTAISPPLLEAPIAVALGHKPSTVMEIDVSSFKPGDWLEFRARSITTVANAGNPVITHTFFTPQDKAASIGAGAQFTRAPQVAPAAFPDTCVIDTTKVPLANPASAYAAAVTNTECRVQFDPCQFAPLFGNCGVRKMYVIAVTANAAAGVQNVPAGTAYTWGAAAFKFTAAPLDAALTTLTAKKIIIDEPDAATTVDEPQVAGQPLVVPLPPSYRKTKEIIDGQWHFYDFNIPTNTGYYARFTVTINTLLCGTPLDVFHSYQPDAAANAPRQDIYRPARYATQYCNAQSGQLVNAGSVITVTLDEPCQIHGGRYRVAVYARDSFNAAPNAGSNTLQTPIIPPLPAGATAAEYRGTTYQITADLFEYDHVELPLECPHTQVALDTLPGVGNVGIADIRRIVRRYELHVPAENRGTQLRVQLALTDFLTGLPKPPLGAAGVSRQILRVSTNPHPHPRRVSNNAQCNWGVQAAAADSIFTQATSTLGDFECEIISTDAAARCVIDIPACEFRGATIYAFLDLQAAGTAAVPTGLDTRTSHCNVTISTEFDRKYIPIADLNGLATAANTSVQYSGLVSTRLDLGNNLASRHYYQYYKVIVNKADPKFLFKARLQLFTCTNAVCANNDVRMAISRGNVGFAAFNHAAGLAANRDYATGGCDITRAVTTQTNSFTGVFNAAAVAGAVPASCSCHDHHDALNGANGFNANLMNAAGTLAGVTIFDEYCGDNTLEKDVYFIGVQHVDNTRLQCEYRLEVSSAVPVTDLFDTVAACGRVACYDHYKLVNYTKGEQTQIVVNIINLGGVGSNLILNTAFGRIPFTSDPTNRAVGFSGAQAARIVCPDNTNDNGRYQETIVNGIAAGNAAGVITLNEGNADGCESRDLYIGVFRQGANLNACDQCNQRIPYQLTATVTKVLPVNIPATITAGTVLTSLLNPVPPLVAGAINYAKFVAAADKFYYVHRGTFTRYFANAIPQNGAAANCQFRCPNAGAAILTTQWDVLRGSGSTRNPLGFALVPTTYYFEAPISNLEIREITFADLSLTGTTRTAVTLSRQAHFPNTIPTRGDYVKFYTFKAPTTGQSSRTATLRIEDYENTCAGTTQIGYTIQQGGPLFDCTQCPMVAANTLTADACNKATGTPITCVDNTLYYVTFFHENLCNAAGAQVRCDITFTAWIDFGVTHAPLTNGVHSVTTNAFQKIENCLTCEGPPTGTTNSWYVDVAEGENILSVALREPFGGSSVDPGTFAVTATLSRGGQTAGNCDAETCVATQTESGEVSSCRVDATPLGALRYNYFSCVPAGRYYVEVTRTADATLLNNYDYWGYEIQAVTKWTALTGELKDTLQGAHRHFFKITGTADKSVDVALTVTNGPALDFVVFDGCDMDSRVAPSAAGVFNRDAQRSFHESKVCAAGTCYTTVATRALHSNGAASYYVVLTGKAIAGPVPAAAAPAAAAPARRQRSQNTVSDKPTAYTITATIGTANCGAVTGEGWCTTTPTNMGADTTPVSTNNPLTGRPLNTGWKYPNVTAKHLEAQHRWNTLIRGRCPSASDSCKRWLRVWSCLESFNSCDADGFIVGQCDAVCKQVEIECGQWLQQIAGVAVNQPRYEFQCCSDRYITGDDKNSTHPSTCHPTPPPPTVANATNVTVSLVRNDTTVVIIHTLDVHLVSIPITAGAVTLQSTTTTTTTTTKKRAVEQTLCTSTTLKDLIVQIATINADQVKVLEIRGNSMTVEIIGDTTETSTSIAVRVVNIITARPVGLIPTCLDQAVAAIEEPSDLIGLDTPPPPPPSPSPESDDDGDDDGDDNDGRLRIPLADLSGLFGQISSATSLSLPIMLVMVCALLAMLM